MKNQKRNGILVGLAVSLLSLVIYSCTQSGPCEGSLTLENPIPDITVAVGDTVLIDLTAPPVFVSSEKSISYFPVLLSGYSNVEVSRVTNPSDNDRLSILRIRGREIGDAVLELQASSDCLENSTTFKITIKKS